MGPPGSEVTNTVHECCVLPKPGPAAPMVARQQNRGRTLSAVVVHLSIHATKMLL
jgi:hypothetical protein